MKMWPAVHRPGALPGWLAKNSVAPAAGVIVANYKRAGKVTAGGSFVYEKQKLKRR
jgi:hypothetical protein